MSRLIRLTLAGFFFLSGCVVIPGGITDSNIPITDYSYVEVVGETEGTDSALSLFGIIPLGKPDIQAALHLALRRANADALLDITWETKYTHYLFFMQTTITVKGTAVRFNAK